MNNVNLSGRLAAEPTIKTTSNGVTFCQFALAVNRPFKDDKGKRIADFIDCVAWRKNAEIIGQYATKGGRLNVTGCIQKRSYKNNNNVDVYVTEVIVDNIEIIDFKKKEDTQPSEAQTTAADTAPTKPDAPSIETADDFEELGLPFEF